MNIVLIFKM